MDPEKTRTEAMAWRVSEEAPKCACDAYKHIRNLITAIDQLQARVEELEGENKRLRTACDEFIYNESHGEQEGGD